MLHLNKIILGVLLLLFLGCNSSLVENKGSVSITIPSVSKVVLDELNSNEIQRKDSDDSSRAFVVSDNVVVSIYQAGVFVKSQEASANNSIEIVLDEGIYTLSIDIYNNENSSIDPSVSGISDEFVVTAGVATSVHVKLLPVSPSVAEEGSVVSLTDYTNGDYDMFSNYTDLFGSEHWYEITPSTSVTTIESVNSDSGFNSAQFVLYNNLGEFVDGANLFSVLTLDTIPGETYYLAVLPMAVYDFVESYSSTNVEFTYYATSTVDYDNSATDATAITADGGLILGELVGPTDTDFYSIAVTAGEIYRIQNNGDSYYITLTDSLGNIIMEGNFYDSFLYTADSDDILYMELFNPLEVTMAYQFKVSTIVDTMIVPSSEWLTVNIEFQLSSFYTFNVTPGTSYTVSWDSSWEGSGVYDADVIVEATDNLGNTYFSSDEGYIPPHIITPGEGVTTVTLDINGFYIGGELGLLVEEVIQ